MYRLGCSCLDWRSCGRHGPKNFSYFVYPTQQVDVLRQFDILKASRISID